MANAGKHFLPSYLFTEKTVGTPEFPPLLRRENEKAVPPGKLPDETAGKRSPPPDQYL